MLLYNYLKQKSFRAKALEFRFRKTPGLSPGFLMDRSEWALALI